MKRHSWYIQMLLSISTAAVLFSTGCSQKKAAPPEFPVMKFEITDTLLGQKIECVQSGFSFKAPLEWKEADNNELRKAAEALSQTSSEKKGISISPLYIFVRSNGCILNIAKIKLPASSIDLKDEIKSYENIFFGNPLPQNVKKALYSKDGIKIVQYLLQDNKIDFRILFFSAKGDLIQFDYLTDKKNYLNEVKAIESSIGSINLTKK